MGEQTEMAVQPMREGDWFEVRHRSASHRLDFEFIGSTGTKGLVRFRMDDVIEFWLWTEGKHKAGDFAKSSMVDWVIEPSSLDRCRRHAAKTYKGARKRLGIKEAIEVKT